MALLADGSRLLSLNIGGRPVVLALDSDGEYLWRQREFFEDFFAGLDDGERVREEIAMWSDWSAALVNNEIFSRSAFDNVVVSRDGETLFTDDFATGGVDGWLQGSSFVEHEVRFVGGWVVNETVTIDINRNLRRRLRRIEETWQDFLLAADVLFEVSTIAGIEIGESSLQPLSSRLKVASPLVWSAGEGASSWGSIAALEEGVILVQGTQRYSLDPAGEERGVEALTEPISELRFFARAGSRRPWIGICLPEENAVAIGPTTFSSFLGQFTWRFSGLINPDVIVLGGGAGAEEGAFLVPLSFYVGPDGRIFTVNAGNGRVQVFDAEGQFLTQWGRPGSADGEFDFTGAGNLRGFSGSVVVDDEGFVYVADVFNRRIQKFAP